MLSCKGSNFIDSSIISPPNKGGGVCATIRKIHELTEYELLSTSTKYQHLNFYENIYSSLVHTRINDTEFYK